MGENKEKPEDKEKIVNDKNESKTINEESQQEEKQNKTSNEETQQTENQNNQESENKQGFFKKVWYSITKIEKYPEMAAQGVGTAMAYLAKLVAILAIVLGLGQTYIAHNEIKEGVTYLQEQFPEFTYKDGTLNVESDTPIEISEDDSMMGRVIIDTKVDSEGEIKSYLNKIGEAGGGALILKDEIRIKKSVSTGDVTYLYKDILSSFEVTEFDKQDVIDYANSNQIITLYISIFITVFIYIFMMYYLTSLSNVVLLSFFGYLTTLLAKIKIRYVAILNMSTYAVTLSTILNIIYIAVNIFVPFEMEYFQVMYVAVAAIYLVAAILILKSDFINKQIELMKIIEEQDVIRKQLEEKARQEEEERRKRQKDEKNKKEKDKNSKDNLKEGKKEEKKDNNVGEEPQGSNA